MSILDRIDGHLLEKLKTDELQVEKIRLERAEEFKISEMTKLSDRKKELFNQGFQASDAERRVLAGKIQAIDKKLKTQHLQLKDISGKIPLLNHLIFLVENRQVLEKKGLWEQIASMTKAELLDFITRVSRGEQRTRTGDRIRTRCIVNVKTGPGPGFPEIVDANYPGHALRGATGRLLMSGWCKYRPPFTALGEDLGTWEITAPDWLKVQFDAGYVGWCSADQLEWMGEEIDEETQKLMDIWSGTKEEE